MTAYLPKIFTTYNNRGATPSYTQSPETLSYKAFRASLTLTAAGYIGTRYAAAHCYLALGKGLAFIESVAQGNNSSFPLIQALFDTLPHPETGISGIQFFQHIVIHANGIHQRQRVPVSVTVNGIGQRYLPLRFTLSPKVHQNLIFNTAGRISGKAYLFVRLKGTDPLDETDGSNGDQIILISIGGIVFF